ncbi:HdeD family acid-resistance protein [Thiolapillus sp.]|uniref:HdeD family acid-resistance protein n=1 Tax=Thiolapillus sp. TaxID=2017437 RepID=UPI003AF4B496
MEKDNPIDFQELQLSIIDYLQKHWKVFFWEGVFFVILGTLAIVAPHVFTMGITIFLGWLLLIGGILQVVRAASIYNMPGFGLWFFMGILQAVIGYFFLKEPGQGSLTLTLVVTVFFALEGLAKIYLAFMMRPIAHWGRILFSGITALLLAIVVWAGWPATGLWVLGLLLGINMVLLGWTLITLSLQHKLSE